MRGIAGLTHQVELVEDGLLVFTHHFDGSEALAAFPVVVREMGERVQHLEIARDHRVHAGPQDLDHHLACLRAIEADLGPELGGVHLRNRRGGQRLFLEHREHLLGGAAVGLLDDGARDTAVEGWHAVLELGELVGDVRGQQVAARGQRLAELDEDGAQLLQCLAQPFGARRLATAHRPGPRRQQEQESQRPIQVGGAHEFVQPVPHQHALDLDQPGDDPQLHRWFSGASSAACSMRRVRASSRSRSSRSRSTPR